MTTTSARGTDLLPAEYGFGEVGTDNSTGLRERSHRGTIATSAATLLLPIALAMSGIAGTSSGGADGFLPQRAVGGTYRGEFAPTPAIAVRTVRPQAVTRAVVTDVSRTDREEISWVKANSGLTWDQLGKVFGVSRRAVHMWSNGGRLNESNARRLREFSAIVKEIQATISGVTPDDVRAKLLDVGTDGMSVVDRLRRERSSGATWGMPVGPEHLIDAIRESAGEVGQ
ncbi:hypothetical protein EB75_01450 [Mycobacterium sp. ST-F2]|uniref:hypothetical protein n=1 Tax=Mycobacterium sp. ST-F2 TaxID=1490484 RepID=UPI00093E4129|nr:hypothetical protein [Mycobacterium sp. ST-F2]OKH85030.1 hypothetical protein EB75_01450 [Mycobacterium sp. ST-F2]